MNRVHCTREEEEEEEEEEEKDKEEEEEEENYSGVSVVDNFSA